MASSSTAATSAAARGTLLSVLLRLTSFLLSQLTVRHVSASTLGKANIVLELLLGTALFVGREGFRLGLTKNIAGVANGSSGEEEKEDANGASPGDCGVPTKRKFQRHESYLDENKKENRQRDEQQMQQQRIINVSWLSVPTGAVLSILAVFMHLYSCSSNNNTSNANASEMMDYKLAGILYCIASFIESLSEPLVIRCLQEMDVTTKAKAEGAALVCKAVACFGMLHLTSSVWFWEAMKAIVTRLELGVGGSGGQVCFAVTAFGVSQLVYAITFTTIMFRKARATKDGIRWPKRIHPFVSNPYRSDDTTAHQTQSGTTPLTQNFDLHTLHLILIFTLQGLFKHALTEADKIVLSTLAGSYDQGVYALASSYGGLAARLLLQPLEENARLLFSRQGALLAQQLQDATTTNGSREKDTQQYEKKQTIGGGPNNLLSDLESTYCFLLRAVLYIGLIFATIATNYTSLLLRILAGDRWGSNSEASAALSAFCVYTAFLALNGTTEAFVYGVARSGRDVGKLGVAHAVVGGIFALISPGLVRSKGAVGLVTANCVCMGLRSAYSLYYARTYFAKAEEALSGGKNDRISMISQIAPHPVVLALFSMAYAVTKSSRDVLYDGALADGAVWTVAALTHVLVGILSLALTMTVSLYFESDIRASFVRLMKRKRE